LSALQRVLSGKAVRRFAVARIDVRIDLMAGLARPDEAAFRRALRINQSQIFATTDSLRLPPR
jgi:hypothetical protein